MSLDALEAAERTKFQAHLTTCEPCRDEVVQFRETAAELSVLSRAHSAAKDVWQRVRCDAHHAPEASWDEGVTVLTSPGPARARSHIVGHGLP